MAATTAPLLTIPVVEKIENFVDDVPTNVFAFPDAGGLYHGERIVFEREGSGVATRAVVGASPLDKADVLI